jgi:hypothetical protein
LKGPDQLLQVSGLDDGLLDRHDHCLSRQVRVNPGDDLHQRRAWLARVLIRTFIAARAAVPVSGGDLPLLAAASTDLRVSDAW